MSNNTKQMYILFCSITLLIYLFVPVKSIHIILRAHKYSELEQRELQAVIVSCFPV